MTLSPEILERNVCYYGYLTVSGTQLDGREAGLDLIIGVLEDVRKTKDQQDTENMAVLTTSSFYVYLDAFRPSLGQRKRSEAFPPWGCLVF